MYKLFYGHTILYTYIPYPCSSESNQMRSAIESLTYIARQRPYIRSFGAYNPQRQLHALHIKRLYLYLINHEKFSLQLYLLALSRQFIGTLTIYLHRREHRWNLPLLARESRDHLLDQLASDMLRWIRSIYLLLQVKTGRSGSQLQGCHIFFLVCL